MSVSDPAVADQVFAADRGPMNAQEARTDQVDRALDQTMAAQSGEQVGAELFAVVDALRADPQLRRALTEPSLNDDQRQAVAQRLLGAAIGPGALNVVQQAVALKWPKTSELVAALERNAVRATLAEADRDGALDRVSDELFDFGRTVATNGDLEITLSDRNTPATKRQQLVDTLLAGKADPRTVELAKRAVISDATIGHAIADYLELAAAQQKQQVALVEVARPLTDEQYQRLQAALSKSAHDPVGLQVIVNPEVLGGVRVTLGDEVTEGTMQSRLADADRLFERRN